MQKHNGLFLIIRVIIIITTIMQWLTLCQLFICFYFPLQSSQKDPMSRSIHMKVRGGHGELWGPDQHQADAAVGLPGVRGPSSTWFSQSAGGRPVWTGGVRSPSPSSVLVWGTNTETPTSSNPRPRESYKASEWTNQQSAFNKTPAPHPSVSRIHLYHVRA